ncbi:AraC family ligand binding domain-containing protein [Pedobacter sp. NJ-S-72]
MPHKNEVEKIINMSNIKSYPFSPINNPLQSLHFIKISERIRKGEGLVEIAHRTDFYLISIVNEGTSKHMIDFQEVTVNRGDILIITPGQVHKFINNEVLRWVRDDCIPKRFSLSIAAG